jgi:hypothetical protein
MDDTRCRQFFSEADSTNFPHISPALSLNYA